MGKYPICSTKGGEIVENWDWNKNTKRKPARKNLKSIVYQAQKLPTQITNLSYSHIRLPTSCTSVCAEELRCQLFGINILGLSFHFPSILDVWPEIKLWDLYTPYIYPGLDQEIKQFMEADSEKA